MIAKKQGLSFFKVFHKFCRFGFHLDFPPVHKTRLQNVKKGFSNARASFFLAGKTYRGTLTSQREPTTSEMTVLD